MNYSFYLSPGVRNWSSVSDKTQYFYKVGGGGGGGGGRLKIKAGSITYLLSVNTYNAYTPRSAVTSYSNINNYITGKKAEYT